ncbi:hypothetical protein EDD29_8186 [Actinocorallia herbida]|uniref:ARB-07466-like C-terminal domain-containing protein n=1 Tax=Actinocorallia herbida TaxID=58109 RepID=A0A3N1DAD2_9ACTN|nr:hypothetical protein [Actinocorallia herbida]ROO90459.1 hypothetical protein EDD29_8186 [Actinocorallia herbida]
MTPIRLRAGTALLAAVAGALMLAAPSSGVPSALPTDPDKLASLTKQMKALDKELGGELEELEGIRREAKKAIKRQQDLSDDLDKSRNVVSRLASSQYMSVGLDPSLAVLQIGDPSQILAGMAMVEHLSSNEANRTNQIQELVDLHTEAANEAKRKIKKMEDTVSDLTKRKDDIRKLIQKYQPTPMVGNTSLTARLVALRTAVLDEFGSFPMIGCLRPGDPQDHGTGRACDFMESTGGTMPTADRVQHGDEVAAWAIKNAAKYGVKYVIWKQRIYDMRSPGWAAMSDRGSLTANHYDHVHISVF